MKEECYFCGENVEYTSEGKLKCAMIDEVHCIEKPICPSCENLWNKGLKENGHLGPREYTKLFKKRLSETTSKD